MYGHLLVDVVLMHNPQGNVLIDDFGNPRLTDFGLATVVEDPELQWSTITLGHNFDPRWRAPEVLGIKDDPERPTFKSDIYSFGSVMFFVCLLSFCSSILIFLRSSLGIYRGKRKGSPKSVLSWRQESPQRVLITSVMITGT